MKNNTAQKNIPQVIKKNNSWDKEKEIEKVFLKSNVERCRELYDTDILFDGKRKNPFVQSVFIELLIRLRHIDHILNTNNNIKNIRDAAAHPYLHREIEGTGIFVDFCRNFKGNWKYENDIFEKQDDTCDVNFQFGDLEISAKEISKLIEEFEEKIKMYEK